MATFVESATLKLNKQEAQRTIRTINDLNKRLRMLDRTAQSLARTFDRLELFNTASLRKGSRELGRIQAQMQALRNQAQRPITQRVNVIQGGVVPPGAVPPPGGRRMPGGGLALDVKSIIVYGAAITIARSAITGFNERDVADARVAAQTLSPAQQQLFDAQALELARTTPGLNIAQARQLMAENLGSAQQDVIASRRITEATQPLIEQQVALGKTWDEAISEQSKIVRSLEQTGRITDAQGNIDVAKLESAVALERAIASVLGVEYSGAARHRTAKLSRISGLTMNDPAVATLALMAEEQGTTAAVGYNQAIQNLAVRMTKRSEAQLESLGLRAGGETKGEKLLRTNLPAWIDQFLEPALEKNGIDTDDPAAVASAVAKIAGDRTSQAAIAALLLRDEELERQTAEILRRQGVILGGGDLGIDESSRNSFARLQQEFIGFLGTVVNEFEGPLIRAMDGTSRAFEIMSDLTERLSDPMKELLGLVGGAGLAGGGFFALKNITGLATAGPALTKSAAELSAAALALQRAAGAQGLGGIANAFPADAMRGLGSKIGLLTMAIVKMNEAADENMVRDPVTGNTYLWQRTPVEERNRLRTQIGPQLPAGGTFGPFLPTVDPASPNLVEEFQKWVNRRTGAGIDEDNILGPQTLAAMGDTATDFFKTLGGNLMNEADMNLTRLADEATVGIGELQNGAVEVANAQQALIDKVGGAGSTWDGITASMFALMDRIDAAVSRPAPRFTYSSGQLGYQGSGEGPGAGSTYAGGGMAP